MRGGGIYLEQDPITQPRGMDVQGRGRGGGQSGAAQLSRRAQRPVFESVITIVNADGQGQAGAWYES